MLPGEGEVLLQPLDAITAAADSLIGDAVPLSGQMNRISVCAGAADSVCLPPALKGDFRVVFNDGAAAAQIFCRGSTIDGVAGTTGVPLTNGKRAIFFCFTDGAWISAQLGVVSA